MTLVWTVVSLLVLCVVAVCAIPAARGAARRLFSKLKDLAALRKTSRGKLLIEWAIFTFAPVVVFPLFVFCGALFSRDQELTISSIGGRGDFAFMGVALAATAQVSVRNFRPPKGDPTDNHPLAGLTMLALLFSAGAWGLAAGQGSNGQNGSGNVAEPAHALFFAVTGLIILVFCTLVAAATACLDPRLTASNDTLTFVTDGGSL